MRELNKHPALALLPLLLGVLAFFLVIGPRALDPQNIAWLKEGDPATHYLGWLYFRHAPWAFPLGLNPSYGLELGSAVIFSDSNPLLALLVMASSKLAPLATDSNRLVLQATDSSLPLATSSLVRSRTPSMDTPTEAPLPTSTTRL